MRRTWQYVADPTVKDGKPGWCVRDLKAEGDNRIAFFPNKNNNPYMPDWHVFRAKLTAWYYNHFRWGRPA